MHFSHVRRRIIERQIENCRGLIEMQRAFVEDRKARGIEASSAEVSWHRSSGARRTSKSGWAPVGTSI